MPVVAIAPNDALLEKLKSNLQEVRARGGELYVVADLDSHLHGERGHPRDPRCPEHAGLLSPVVHAIPLQLLAYHTAVLRGTDVDKPRNLGEVRHGGVTRAASGIIIITPPPAKRQPQRDPSAKALFCCVALIACGTMASIAAL